MAEKRRRRTESRGGELEMTPMIDVVFQLLIYFVVTIKPMDIAAHLDVNRPAAKAATEQNVTPPKMIRIQIFREGLIMNDRTVTVQTMTEILQKLAAISTTQTVMIMCARDSEHDMLIQVLDRCAKVGMQNLSVVSMN